MGAARWGDAHRRLGDAGGCGLNGLVLLAGGVLDGVVGPAPAHGDHIRSEAGVRSQDTVASMAVDSGRGDESRQALEQLERGEGEDGPAVGGGAGQPVEESGLGRGERIVALRGMETVEGERQAGTIADQPFDPVTVVAFDPDRGIDAEPGRLRA